MKQAQRQKKLASYKNYGNGFINFAKEKIKQIKDSFCGFLRKIFNKNKPQSLPKVELEILGYDDAESQSYREYLREHLIQNILRNYAETQGSMPTTAFEEETNKYSEKLTR